MHGCRIVTRHARLNNREQILVGCFCLQNSF